MFVNLHFNDTEISQSFEMFCKQDAAFLKRLQKRCSSKTRLEIQSKYDKRAAESRNKHDDK